MLKVLTRPHIATGGFDPGGLSGAPDTPGLAYVEMASVWDMLTTVMAGTEDMRLAGELYLPRFAAETVDDYKARLAKTTCANFFEDAVRNAASLPFKKPVTLSDDSPEWLQDLSIDIDLEGHDVSEFARQVLEDGILMGYSFILVDHTNTSGATNLAQERAANARPYWSHIRAEDMLCINVERVNGEDVVTHARYWEAYIDRDGFTERLIPRVRVFEPGYYWLYEQRDGWGVVEEGPISLDRIPIVPVMCGRRLYSKFTVKPLFLDLAYKQIEHWQSSSDQRNILTFARFPMLACAGAGTEEASTTAIGPNRMLTTADPQGRWYYVEPKGDAIEAGRKDLEALQEQMRILGLQPTVGVPGNVTATARALDETRVHSAVQVLALNLEGALNKALDFTMQWKGDNSSKSHAYVNRDYGISLRDSREIDALLRSRVAGELSRETFWAEMKRRNVLAADFDAKEEQERITKEIKLGITLPGASALPGPNAGLQRYAGQQAFLNRAGGVSEQGTMPDMATQAGAEGLRG